MVAIKLLREVNCINPHLYVHTNIDIKDASEIRRKVQELDNGVSSRINVSGDSVMLFACTDQNFEFGERVYLKFMMLPR